MSRSYLVSSTGDLCTATPFMPFGRPSDLLFPGTPEIRLRSHRIDRSWLQSRIGYSICYCRYNKGEMFPFFWALLFALFFSVFAGGATQQPPNSSSAPVQTPPAAPPQGLQAPWDIKQMLTVLNAQNQALKPLLDSMHP